LLSDGGEHWTPRDTGTDTRESKMVHEKPGTFARWAEARKKLAWISARWAEGRTVYLSTVYRCWKLGPKHAENLKATRSGLLMRSGKSWVTADGCAVRAV